MGVRFFCHAINVEMIDGDSAWNRRHNKGHQGKRESIPFGALVDFLPDKTETKWRGHGKFAPKAVPGVFLGWYLQTGHVWRREYLVASLDDCRELNLRYDVIGADSRLPVHRVREVVFRPPCTFPLKDR